MDQKGNANRCQVSYNFSPMVAALSSSQMKSNSESPWVEFCPLWLALTIIFDESAKPVTPMTTQKIIQVGQDESGGQEAMEIRDCSVKEWRHFVDHHRHHPNKHLRK